MVNCISLEKSFDVKTLYTLMTSTDEETNQLIERNVKRFRSSFLVSFSENLPELNRLTQQYKQELEEKIKFTKLRLLSTDNGHNISEAESIHIFKRTISAVHRELDSLDIDTFINGSGLEEKISDYFEILKADSLVHLSMFNRKYVRELDTNEDRYLKRYVHTMIKNGYIFNDEKGESYSLLIFLSFYEAYVKRIFGLSFLELAKKRPGAIKIALKAQDSMQTKFAEDIFHYSKKVKVTDAKNCYFSELQKWFRGELDELIEKFLIISVEEDEKGYRQPSTLIQKKKVHSGECLNILEPPISIPSPPLIDSFFLLRDSHYMIM